MKVVIVLPTYNERDNVASLIDDLQAQFLAMPHEMSILVVDDHSPDGTAEVVRTVQARYPNVDLIEGKREGLGAAYVRGFRHAIAAKEADVLFEMDADFSHKPEDIPRLMAAVERGADFVIGSRYVDGGRISADWGLLRRLNSRGGNLIARYVAGIYRVRDCTAGFRAIRTSLLRQIDFSELHVQGYAFQLALLHAATSLRARVVEIPVEFVDRRHGVSKLGLSDIVEFILNAWWIRLQNSRTLAKFLIVGASGVAVNLGMFSFLLAVGMNKYIASPIAIEVSIVSNFLFNNYWTFRWRKVRGGIKLRGLKYNVVSFLSLAVSYTTFVALSVGLPHVAPQVHQLIGIIPAILVNYFLNSYWTFRHDPIEIAAVPGRSTGANSRNVRREEGK
jgi:dolichol-phosphate mannosyltransferase